MGAARKTSNYSVGVTRCPHLLSANLAVINILPFPPMDGGRMAMAIAQRLSGGRISVQLERAIYFSGFVALMALLVWISIFDIRRLGGG